ncbi:MAG: DUF2911 domain-containing protein [Nonlabens sp.]
MKKYILLVAIAISSMSMMAQDFDPIDKSPMDAAFYPPQAAKRQFAKTGDERIALEPQIRVLYSRPALNGRNIFRKGDNKKDGITQYGELWRLGANESTELLLMKDAMIGGESVKAGRYSMVVTPMEDQWIVHINFENDGWGNYSYKKDLNVISTKIPVSKDNKSIEHLSIALYTPGEDNIVHMKIGWGTYRAEMPIVLM